MPIYMMFGNYTAEALRGISPERTKKVEKLVKANEGEVRSMYAVMGEHDLVFICEFPDAEKAMMTSVAIERLTGIIFRTSPVVEVEKFDRMVGKAEQV
ncbi:MAG: GYD domain-containing protein [Deferrisomatales bacterium]